MDPMQMTVDQILAIPVPSYLKLLEIARAHGRSRIPERQELAVELLGKLAERYPHALAIGQELVLLLMELDRHPAAEKELKRFEETFPDLDEELLCRWGRLFKDEGDKHLAAGNPDLAQQCYGKSIAQYGKAYQHTQGHYPGINKATLLLILAALKASGSGGPPPPQADEAADLAGKILSTSARWKSNQADDVQVWFPATIAEAHLLRQEWDQAANHYREALRSARITQHAGSAMRRQADRILGAFATWGIQPSPPFDNTDSFFRLDPIASSTEPAI